MIPHAILPRMAETLYNPPPAANETNQGSANFAVFRLFRLPDELVLGGEPHSTGSLPRLRCAAGAGWSSPTGRTRYPPTCVRPSGAFASAREESRGVGTSSPEPLARLAHEDHGLREDLAHRGQQVLRLLLGVALKVQPVDARHRHVDRELDRIVGPGHLLRPLHLLGELRHAPPQLVGVAEQSAEWVFRRHDPDGRGRRQSGSSTIALPPPRRVGSAAARTLSPPRNSSPVTAPISGVSVNTWPYLDASSFRTSDVMKAGSALVAVVLRWLARGAAIACGSVDPRSRRSSSTWSTVVMIIEPPGDPTARNGRPSARTIVGLIELRGRFPPSARFGCVKESKLKSVSSLLSRKP